MANRVVPSARVFLYVAPTLSLLTYNRFSEGHITSDADGWSHEAGEYHRPASTLNDLRNPKLVRRKPELMTREQSFCVATGYEDWNGHEALRFD